MMRVKSVCIPHLATIRVEVCAFPMSFKAILASIVLIRMYHISSGNKTASSILGGFGNAKRCPIHSEIDPKLSLRLVVPTYVADF